jgi:hypothetical protein
MGCWPTVPRMPSVPKYFLVMCCCPRLGSVWIVSRLSPLRIVTQLRPPLIAAPVPSARPVPARVSRTSCTRTMRAPRSTASSAAATLATSRGAHPWWLAREVRWQAPATICATSPPAAGSPPPAARAGAPAALKFCATVLPKPMPGSSTMRLAGHTQRLQGAPVLARKAEHLGHHITCHRRAPAASCRLAMHVHQADAAGRVRGHDRQPRRAGAAPRCR